MRVLLVKTSSMGDVIHALPALTDAAKVHPNIKFDWVVEEGFAEIPSWHQNVDRVIPVALRRWRKNFFNKKNRVELSTFLKKLREQQYDVVIDAQGLLKSAIITRLAKGKCCGLARDSAREPLASWFYTKKYSIAKNMHAVTRIRQLFADSLAYDCPQGMPDYGIEPSVFAQVSQQTPYLMFIHGTSRDDKCWPEQQWIELGRAANQQGFAIALPWGSQEEQARAERIAEACEQAEVLPRSKLGQLAAQLYAAKGAVCVDTGLGHLAAALAVPTVALYGPTDPNKIGTLGHGQTHVDMHHVSPDAILEQLVDKT